MAREQRHPELRLELVDAAPQRIHRLPQVARRGPEAAALGHFEKGADVLPVRHGPAGRRGGALLYGAFI